MIRASFVVAYLCNECGTVAPVFDHQAPYLPGALPVPTLPEGWIERTADHATAHYCGDACEALAFEKRREVTT